MEKRHNSIDCPSTLQTIPKEKEFHFYTMQNGAKITCHGRPKKSDIAKLYKEHNANYILTIQGTKEQPEIIGQYCNEVSPDIHWEHLPLRGASMSYFMREPIQKQILNYIISLYDYIKQHNNTVIFIHCAAGVHRTGTMLYTILRGSGENKEKAMEIIKNIRIETFRNVGENRIKYAEEFLVRPLLELLGNK